MKLQQLRYIWEVAHHDLKRLGDCTESVYLPARYQ